MAPPCTAASALADCVQAATCAPRCRPAYRKERSLLASQSSTILRRMRIQIRISDGKSPMGRKPPSDLASKTMDTNSTNRGHSPVLSASMNISISSSNRQSERRPMARGWIASHARPVPVGKDWRARRSCCKVGRGGIGPRLEGHCMSGGVRSAPQCFAHTSASASTACCASRGCAGPLCDTRTRGVGAKVEVFSQVAWSSCGEGEPMREGAHPCCVRVKAC